MTAERDGGHAELSVGVPAGLPHADRERWDAMTAAQRRRAADRLDAIVKWNVRAITIEQALERTGLSRSRFYRMAAEWRTAPSLAVLGAFAGKGGTRSRLDPDAINALQAVVAKVVSMNVGASVSQLVQMMVRDAGVPAKRLPGASKLRAIVADEQRRVAATGDAGHALRFDCSAVNLPRPDGRPYALFACLDAGTRVILGAAIVEEPKAVEGYRIAAIDARERVHRLHNRLPWALRTARIEITAGTDLEESARLVERLRAADVRANPQLARTPRRFGRYFRTVVGTRLGRVEITPLRTEQGAAVTDNGDMTPWTLEEANAALRLAVDRHNEDVLAAMSESAGGRVPDDLARTLEVMAED